MESNHHDFHRGLVFKTSCRPFSATLQLAEGAGIEPAHDFHRGFGLANQRITSLPTFGAAVSI